MFLRGQTTEFHMHEYPPFQPVVPYSTKQAMGKGKSCSVETRLNGLVATALYELESHLRQ